jgi:hypothetical protein
MVEKALVGGEDAGVENFLKIPLEFVWLLEVLKSNPHQTFIDPLFLRKALVLSPASLSFPLFAPKTLSSQNLFFTIFIDIPNG